MWVNSIFDKKLVRDVMLKELKYNLYIFDGETEKFMGKTINDDDISFLLANNQIFIYLS